MSEEQVTITLVIRPDQERLLRFVAKRMSVSVSALMRWTIYDGLASLLARASLQETDLPSDARRDGSTQAAK